MKIFVCGDSFCSADAGRPGTHFSELLQNHGHDVTNLARGGMSNIGIAFQIREAVIMGAELIVFATTESRFTIPTGKKDFELDLGLKNFCYPYKCDLSSQLSCVGGVDAALWTDTINAMLTLRHDTPDELRLSSAQIDALQKYIAYLYEPELQTVTDNWIIGFWKYRLQELGIKFIELTQTGLGRAMYQYVVDHPELTKQSVYHTDVETQHVVARDILDLLEGYK
jgi:hypothetical protein